VSSATFVTVCDVGPRDGLQNESRTLDPAIRAELCDRLVEAGVRRLEAVSFVSPKHVPQMAGAEEVLAAVGTRDRAVYAGLVVNERGYERAVAARVDEVHYAFPVTDTFAARNQNATVADSAELARRLIGRARDDGIGVTVTLGASFGCPFEGAVDPGRVRELAGYVHEAGPDEIVLADTIGVAVPRQVTPLVGALRELGARVACHFHNTRNTGYANAIAAVDAGAVGLDASIGGIGGCPFAPNATGNIATEDLVYALHGCGMETGIDLEGVRGCAAWLAEQLGKGLPGMVYRAGGFAPVAA
jgi:isopropylmalate/homocitrate/citramalate synthase